MDRPKGKKRKETLLYIVAGEGRNQERLYFERIKEIINSCEKRKFNVYFEYLEPFGGDPLSIVKRAVTKSIGKSNKIAAFDHDGKTVKFEKAVDLAFKNKIAAGYSIYSFELWLLWHKEDYFEKVNSQTDYLKEVKRIYNLSETANIKKAVNVEYINSQINFEDVVNAIKRAEKIESQNRENKKHQTPDGNVYFENPDTKMHQIIKKIFVQTGMMK